jgi:hypothetical protein
MNAEARTAAIMETQSDAAAAPSSLLVQGPTFTSILFLIHFFLFRSIWLDGGGRATN